MRIIRPVKVNNVASFSRASTGTYWDKNGVLQTAVANALRISYDPNDLTQAPYAMVEGAATNYVTDTESPTAWLNSSPVTVPSAFFGKAGTRITTSGASGDAPHAASVVGTYPPGEYTFSVLIDAATNTSGQGAMAFTALSFDIGGGTSSCQRIFEFAGKTINNTITTTGAATPVVVGVVPMGGSIYRIWQRVYFAKSFSKAHLYLNPYEGFSIVGGLPQITDGGLSSIILTTGTPVTRAADVVTGTGLLYSNVPENDYPAWSSTKIYMQGDRILDLTSHKIYESISGLSGTATFTTGQTNNNNVFMRKPDGSAYVPSVGWAISFTGATMPTGLVSGTVYYVVSTAATSFAVSTTVGGAAIAVGTSATATTVATSPNYNVTAPNAVIWLDAGYSNRWDMFDDSVTSQTSQTGDVTVVFSPGARLDAIAGLNMAANSMKIAFTEVTTGNVTYSASVNLISNSGVQNFYAYLYEPIVQMPDCLVDGIPLGLSSSSLITVTFQSNGTTKVGGLVFGLSKDIGVTEWGAKVGIVDYSVKTKDTFGNYTITPRAFSKRGDFTVQVPTGQVDALQNLLAQYRSTPIVYIGSNTGAGRTQFNSTIIYGFYKDFDLNISYNAYSVCSISIEGLT